VRHVGSEWFLSLSGEPTPAGRELGFGLFCSPGPVSVPNGTDVSHKILRSSELKKRAGLPP